MKRENTGSGSHLFCISSQYHGLPVKTVQESYSFYRYHLKGDLQRDKIAFVSFLSIVVMYKAFVLFKIQTSYITLEISALESVLAGRLLGGLEN